MLLGTPALHACICTYMHMYMHVHKIQSRYFLVGEIPETHHSTLWDMERKLKDVESTTFVSSTHTHNHRVLKVNTDLLKEQLECLGNHLSTGGGLIIDQLGR